MIKIWEFKSFGKKDICVYYHTGKNKIKIDHLYKLYILLLYKFKTHEVLKTTNAHIKYECTQFIKRTSPKAKLGETCYDVSKNRDI